jgi:hypothetical protein
VHFCRPSHRPTAVVLPRPLGISHLGRRECQIRRPTCSPHRRAADSTPHTGTPSTRRTRICEWPIEVIPALEVKQLTTRPPRLSDTSTITAPTDTRRSIENKMSLNRARMYGWRLRTVSRPSALAPCEHAAARSKSNGWSIGGRVW